MDLGEGVDLQQGRDARVLRGTRVVGLNRYDGEPIAPAQIAARIEQLAREAA